MRINTVLLTALSFHSTALPRLCQALAHWEQRPAKTKRGLASSSEPSAVVDSSAGADSGEAVELLQRISVLPPSHLLSLGVGETLPLQGTPVTITRVATKPHVFVMRSFVPPEDCRALVSEAQDTEMENAETKSGATARRSKSSVAWLSPGTAEASDFMTAFSCNLFVHEDLLEAGLLDPEPVQVANYQVSGRYDLHHDGMNRLVTVLTYLNGVAGTWFPFAITDEQQPTLNIEEDRPPSLTFDNSMIEGMSPGKDGLFVADESWCGDEGDDSNKVARLGAGDAVVFYSYEYNEEAQSPIMSWRSLHAGMPAAQEKWIATNWIQNLVPSKTSSR